MRNRVLRTLVGLMLGSCLAVISGCNSLHMQYDQFPAPSINPPWLANPKITGQKQVYTHPGPRNLRLSRAGLLHFRCSPNLTEVAPALTQIFHRELLARQIFREIALLPETYSTLREALLLAERHRLDLLVLGEVPYYLDGGTVGQTGLQIDLKVVEVRSGQILWCVTDSINATPRPIINLMVVETRPRPTPGIAALAGRLLARLAATLEQGPPPPPPTGVNAWFSRN